MAASSTSALSSAYGTIDVNSMVTQLMQVERNPEVLLQNRQQQATNKANALDSINADVAAVLSLAKTMNASAAWEPLKTTSSSSAVTTSATTGAVTGALTFTVGHLATQNQVFSSSTLSSTTANVTGAANIVVAAGLGSIGLATVTGGPGLALGAHTVAVTQATTGSVKTADTPVPVIPLTIGAGNNSLNITLNGQTYTLNLANGTYSGPQPLAEAINYAAAAVGAGVTAGVDGTGKLTLTTTREGSAADIQITGGTALADLGLSADLGAIANGTDGKITVDGTETVITDTNPAGAPVALTAPVGSLSTTFAGGLRVGSSTVKSVSVGDGSLGAVVSAINGAGLGVSAAAIKVGDNAYRLQVQSKSYGVAGRINVDLSALTGAGGFSTTAAGVDAAITVAGASTYQVTSSSNTFTDVLPGVSFTINSATADTITVAATRDKDTLAARVQGIVDAVNTTIADIKVKSGYTAATSTKGALLGDSTVQRLQRELTSAVTDVVVGSSTKLANAVGITVNRDGTLAFDKAAFLTAYDVDPAGVQRLFSSGDDTAPNPGIAQRLQTVAKAANDPVTGYVTTSAKGFHTTVDNMAKQIDAFELRMGIREAAMRTQWNGINVALQKLSSESTSLTQQLASIPDISASGK
jgi:flagellar hook-associated protein 2